MRLRLPPARHGPPMRVSSKARRIAKTSPPARGATPPSAVVTGPISPMVAEHASAARCYVDARRTIATDARSPAKILKERQPAMIASVARAYRLAVFTKNWTNPAYAGARLGADRLARRLGCQLTHFVPTKPA